MMFGPLLLIGLVVLAVWYFLQRERRGSDAHQDTPSSRPVEIVRERYARGEISQEEYERIHRDLEQTSDL